MVSLFEITCRIYVLVLYSQFSEEISKLQQRLSLLREEYVKLQKHCEDIEKDRNQLLATSGVQSDSNTFMVNILQAIASMYKNSEYRYVLFLQKQLKLKISMLKYISIFSDTHVIIQDNQVIPAHKFILNARSSNWKWNDSKDLDWSHLPEEVSLALLEWIYTDKVILINRDDTFKLNLMKAAKNFDLPHLLVLCERALIASVQLRNCIRLYTTAEEIGANELKEHCSQLISTHWVLISI